MLQEISTLVKAQLMNGNLQVITRFDVNHDDKVVYSTIFVHFTLKKDWKLFAKGQKKRKYEKKIYIQTFASQKIPSSLIKKVFKQHTDP